MKGVMLHGGQGTRLRPLTFSGPKQLIPVANKPVSQHVLEDMVDSGISEVAIVLGNTFPQLVSEYYGDGSQFNARLTYIYQGEALGIAHAVKLAESYVRDEPFVVYLGDNLLQGGISKYVKTFNSSNYDAMVLLKGVNDPRSFGVAEMADGRISRLVEKPKEPKSNLALIGVYFLTDKVFDIINCLKPSNRGELEITDALQKMVENGYSIGYAIHDGWWLDTGKKDDVLLANQLVLDEKITKQVSEGTELKNSIIEGRVSIGRGSKIENSTIRGPASVAENAIIQDSFIGPYTSVGPLTEVHDGRIENSILLRESRITGVELETSLVGKRCIISGSGHDKHRLRVSLGDYSVLNVE